MIIQAFYNGLLIGAKVCGIFTVIFGLCVIIALINHIVERFKHE